MKLLVKGMLCASLVISGAMSQEAAKVEAKEPAVIKNTTAEIEICTSENADGNITP